MSKWWVLVTLALSLGLTARVDGAPTGTLLISCDVNCVIEFDGELLGEIRAGGALKIPVTLGDHLILGTDSHDRKEVLRETVSINDEKQRIVSLQFKKKKADEADQRQREQEQKDAEKRRADAEKRREQKEKEVDQKRRDRAAEKERCIESCPSRCEDQLAPALDACLKNGEKSCSDRFSSCTFRGSCPGQQTKCLEYERSLCNLGYQKYQEDCTTECKAKC
jgi:hypothetical protein